MQILTRDIYFTISEEQQTINDTPHETHQIRMLLKELYCCLPKKICGQPFPGYQEMIEEIRVAWKATHEQRELYYLGDRTEALTEQLEAIPRLKTAQEEQKAEYVKYLCKLADLLGVKYEEQENQMDFEFRILGAVNANREKGKQLERHKKEYDELIATVLPHLDKPINLTSIAQGICDKIMQAKASHIVDAKLREERDACRRELEREKKHKKSYSDNVEQAMTQMNADILGLQARNGILSVQNHVFGLAAAIGWGIILTAGIMWMLG